MKHTAIRFSSSATSFYFDDRIGHLQKLTDKKSTVLITDENVFNAHKGLFKGWNCIVLRSGEEYKVQATVDAVIEQLIALQADRKTTLVGIGGGVITDITGYTASIYMRGLRFGFLPTSLLAMVDAAIGGKNGIDVGVYKNMVGQVRQPAFILYVPALLETLPLAEWQNGFAEIIKHACIKDARLFQDLEAHSLDNYRQNKKLIASLIERNALIKIRVVKNDEFEMGERRLLNFGHTLGHALENQYELMHGQAVAIGMTYACHIAEQLSGFKQTEKVVNLLTAYGLPTYASFNKQKAMNLLQMDKKRERKEINYVLLEKIGKGTIKTISLQSLEKIMSDILSNP